MGIVEAVFMLLALLIMSPWPISGLGDVLNNATLVKPVGMAILAAGAWNTFWYGLRHLGEFWGTAALVSGILMMAVAVIILVEQGGPGNLPVNNALQAVYKPVKPLETLLLTGLLACFLLYAITLVRLNMDLPIPG